MKTHFGIMEDSGDCESPLIGCEKTLCGCTGEIPCETATDDWNKVDCKKCLKLKIEYELAEKENEKNIIDQMGDMVEFFEKEYVD